MSLYNADADSTRPETPEPNTHQGRRNAPNSVQLLEDDGAVSPKAGVVDRIFEKYCTPRPPPRTWTTHTRLGTAVESAWMDEAGLDAWARDTNGAEFPPETKEEMRDTLDVTEAGHLTFNGFIQIYQLQTENDEEETWRDLSAHGFDRNLNLVSTRRESEKPDTSGIFTPTTRAETPEPNTQEGRRNAGKSVQLLDSDGAVSAKFEAALGHIFQKYSKTTSIDVHKTPTKVRPQVQTEIEGVLSEAGLDAWARDTTGLPWSADSKEEIRTLDVNDKGELTFRGFVQIYQLQAENDEAATWRDLSAHGFDRDLNLVSTRREDTETPVATPTGTHVSGTG
ncbi:EF-hand 1, calcium-binding site protein [Ceratobasidium theobromae]|uniref:EF-hand 1, calcium-binding site protein n=1 Tax=Ceratobasidium theobromae TaxID=1582974 RepID=A0A5N5QNF6_9AGAM|nr:EF-hand 1, calcium-binding site protein [Ceratobasidium theobromae]